jgi:hypothetical protein
VLRVGHGTIEVADEETEGRALGVHPSRVRVELHRGVHVLGCAGGVAAPERDPRREPVSPAPDRGSQDVVPAVQLRRRELFERLNRGKRAFFPPLAKRAREPRRTSAQLLWPGQIRARDACRGLLLARVRSVEELLQPCLRAATALRGDSRGQLLAQRGEPLGRVPVLGIPFLAQPVDQAD